IESFSCLEDYDVLFFDTSAGISRDVLSFCMASQEVLLVVTSEPTSLTDGYSLLKVLSLNGYRNPVKVVMNKAKNERFARAVFDKFNETVKQYLSIEISYAGCIPADETVSAAVTRQRPFTLLYPSTRAAASIEQGERLGSGHHLPVASEAIGNCVDGLRRRPRRFSENSRRRQPQQRFQKLVELLLMAEWIRWRRQTGGFRLPLLQPLLNGLDGHLRPLED
ncbi:MAG: MinD/ParA family protein, partial [Proteobacteria bacterium]|nr:MinD/ParA family protein [Pseudomonadota bacterium]